jgi:radical SAM protein with 4Fe4S-binding SPASM domain
MRDIELRLDITNTCNLRCIMCHQPFAHGEPHLMSLEEFKTDFGDVLRRVNVLFLSWSTEPLLNKELPAILEYAADAGVPCVMLVTNLTLLTSEMAVAFAGGALHRLNVSIDAADPVLYATIRQRDCFNDVIRNARLLREMKAKRHSQWPHIAFNMVLLKMNLHQLKPMIDLAASLGVNELNCTDISVPDRYDRPEALLEMKGLPPSFNLYDEIVDFTDENIRRAIHDAAVHAAGKGVLFSAPGLRRDQTRHALPARVRVARYALKKALRFPLSAVIHLALAYARNFFRVKNAWCSYPWRQMVITADGKVLPCCVWGEASPMGNINEKTLLEIWNDTPFREFRARLAGDNLPPFCRSCTLVRSKSRHGI